MIRRVEGGYIVVSHKGKKLSRKYRSKAEAQKRLRQIEFFKRFKG
jgi:hypothetical protein